MLKHSIVILIMSLVLVSTHARGQDDVLGFIKAVSGEASVISIKGTLTVQPGMPVHLGDKLKTGSDGSLGLTFKDNTVISLGPDTEITVDEYLYTPAKDKLKLSLSLIQGTLHYLSGVIAKLKPEAVSVKTSTGIIGVRGTRFLAKAEAK